MLGKGRKWPSSIIIPTILGFLKYVSRTTRQCSLPDERFASASRKRIKMTIWKGLAYLFAWLSGLEPAGYHNVQSLSRTSWINWTTLHFLKRLLHLHIHWFSRIAKGQVFLLQAILVHVLYFLGASLEFCSKPVTCKQCVRNSETQGTIFGLKIPHHVLSWDIKYMCQTLHPLIQLLKRHNWTSRTCSLNVRPREWEITRKTKQIIELSLMEILQWTTMKRASAFGNHWCS